jgi:hypothetical protein
MSRVYCNGVVSGDVIISSLVVRLLVLCGILAASGSVAQAQEIDCRFFKVAAENLSIYTEPRGSSNFLDSLARNDLVCVAGDQQVGDRKWAYVAYRLLGGEQRKTLDGWAIMSALEPASQDEVARVRNAPPSRAEAERPLPPPPGAFAPPPPPPPPPAAFSSPPPPPPGMAAPSGEEEVIRYSQPIRSFGVPVQGLSLEQLVHGMPEFAPIEGLPDEVWRKPCGSCHQWNRESLCVQARLYAQDEKMAFRKQHPYGGPEKLAMAKWARQGCQ